LKLKSGICILGYLWGLCACTSLFAIQLNVSLPNLDPKLQKILKTSLPIITKTKKRNLSSAEIERLHNKSPETVQTILATHGYYAPTIQSELIKQNQKHWTAIYTISPGKPILLKKVSIYVSGEGSQEPSLRDFDTKPDLPLNKPLNHKAYEQVKQNLLEKSLAAGFLNSHFTMSEVRIDRKNYTAEIQLNLNTDKQFYIAEILFMGTHYPEDFLRRFIPFQENEKYTTQKILALQKALADSRLFSQIQIDPKPNLEDETDDLVPIVISLKARPKNQYTLSLGAGTDTGLRTALAWTRKRAKHPGHEIQTALALSKKRKQLGLNYKILGLNPTRDQIDLFARLKEDRIRDKFSRASEVGLSRNSGYRKFDFLWKLYHLEETYQLSREEPKKRSHFVIPNVKVIWKSIYLQRNEIPYSARKLTLDLKGGLGTLLSSTNFATAQLEGTTIHPLGEKNRLILKGTLGATRAQVFDKVPISMRFFAGGDQSIRGFGITKWLRFLGSSLDS